MQIASPQSYFSAKSLNVGCTQWQADGGVEVAIDAALLTKWDVNVESSHITMQIYYKYWPKKDENCPKRRICYTF